MICGRKSNLALLVLLLLSALSWPLFSDDDPALEIMTTPEIISELLTNLSEREQLLSERESNLDRRETRLTERENALESRAERSSEREQLQIEREKSLTEIENSLKNYAAEANRSKYLWGAAGIGIGTFIYFLFDIIR